MNVYKQLFVLPVDDFNGVLHSLSVQNAEDRSEDLLFVSGHVCVHLVDDGRPDKVAVRVIFHLDVGAVEDHFCALIHGTLDQSLNPRLGRRGYDRAEVGSGLVTSADL